MSPEYARDGLGLGALQTWLARCDPHDAFNTPTPAGWLWLAAQHRLAAKMHRGEGRRELLEDARRMVGYARRLRTA